ncbi:MAG: type II toxin-antitoxin system prevent-host-death family antitoxin [Candidatus Desulforudis sp.]|nr:type II toxin-antitoxin system prevent-host-death family antitoxin [Desulforudis sp.]
MRKVGSYEAKTHLPELLKRVARGERITIMKHGTPVAMLMPVGARGKSDVNTVIREILEFRKGRTLGELSLREMIEEGRE